jgi:molybdopterin molybdotransferase
MVSFEKALEIVINVDYNIKTEIVDIKKCLGKILAEDVFSDINMPPFDKSAVDGFACRNEDIANILDVIEVIQAGGVPKKVVGKNQCSQIMTGAPVPLGADVVLMVEDIESINEKKIRYKKDFVKQNICFFSEDIKENQLVIEKGTLIKASHIAVMATVGYVNVKVVKVPVVGILSTGNEIIEPYLKPEKSQIRNSNSYQLMAQIEKVGAIPNYLGIVEDTEEATYNAIQKAVETSDIILLTGGVSMGEFDLVPKILEKHGFEIHFHNIAIQPGKPTLFAQFNNKYCFGLPGNPVSSFVQFELLVKPLIYRLQGYNYKEKIFKFEYGSDFSRKRVDRKAIVPVYFDENGKVYPVDYHGSAHINSLTLADGLMEVEIGTSIIKKGDIVNVRQI